MNPVLNAVRAARAPQNPAHPFGLLREGEQDSLLPALQSAASLSLLAVRRLEEAERLSVLAGSLFDENSYDLAMEAERLRVEARRLEEVARLLDEARSLVEGGNFINNPVDVGEGF